MLIALFMFMSLFTLRVKAADGGPVIIVIDPGHGGDNLGAEWNNVIEKDMTLFVAKCMRHELEKYDNVEVYLTRENDINLELNERADIAKKYNADILISLHFNMSENHDGSGAEMWAPMDSILNARSSYFGNIELSLLENIGIHPKGIFTRESELTSGEYYGILRYSTNHKIPSIILEHCYLDSPENEKYYATDRDLNVLGRLDATAVAMAYRLKSDELGRDYTEFKYKKGDDLSLPLDILTSDNTAPNYVEVKIYEDKDDDSLVNINFYAYDTQSGIDYYSYSLDGGETFYPANYLYGCPSGRFTLPKSVLTGTNLVVRATNFYNLSTDSDVFDMNKELYGIQKAPEEFEDPEDLINEIPLYVLNEERNPYDVPANGKYAFVLILGLITGISTTLVLFVANKYRYNPGT